MGPVREGIGAVGDLVGLGLKVPKFLLDRKGALEGIRSSRERTASGSQQAESAAERAWNDTRRTDRLLSKEK